ncbi:hypothetical protein [Streptomyces lavendulae]|uniref:hypothetical protein n=1 Tax=Streptomyces lavendulae TaxID=1914 RepID=UPI0036EA3171
MSPHPAWGGIPLPLGAAAPADGLLVASDATGALGTAAGGVFAEGLSVVLSVVLSLPQAVSAAAAMTTDRTAVAVR